MTNYNRIEHLKKLHKERKENTILKVDKAINRLVKSNGTINFNSVSAEAGVSKATLYNNSDIRLRIETLRNQQLEVPSPREVKREMNEKNKDAIIASLRRKIAKLEKENKEFRAQLNQNYAELYKNL